MQQWLSCECPYTLRQITEGVEQTESVLAPPQLIFTLGSAGKLAVPFGLLAHGSLTEKV